MSEEFAGSSPLVARFFPWTQPALTLLKQGGYVGEQLGTGRPVYLDIQWLIKEGIVPSGNIGVVATIGSGKGTLMKDLCLTFNGMQAGVNHLGEHVKTHSRANDYKLEAKSGEWDGVTDFMMRRPHDLAKHGRISPFGAKFGASVIDDTELAILLVSHVKRRPLTSDEVLSLQIVLDEIHRFKHVTPTIELIKRSVDTMTRERASAYKQGDGLKALQSMYADECESNADFAAHFKLLVDVDSNLTSNEALFQRFLEAGASVASGLEELLDGGEYGQMFGGKQDLYDVLNDRYVHLMWVGLKPRARSLLEAVLKFWEIKMSLKDSTNTGLTPHYIFSDEQGSELQNEAHAELEAEENRKRRADVTVKFLMQQYATDLLRLGDEQSRLRAFGETIFKGMAGWFTGQQPDDDETLDAIVRFGATDFEAYQTTKLGVGDWAFIVKGHPAEFFHHRVRPMTWPIIDTRSAARRAGTRQTTSSTKTYEDRLSVLRSLYDEPPSPDQLLEEGDVYADQP